MLKIPSHYWITKHGYLMSSFFSCPTKSNKKIGKVRYIGFTFDDEWPKRMSTGRLFYPPKVKKKKNKNYGTHQPHTKKLSNDRKTDNTIKQQGKISTVPRKRGVVTDSKIS